MESELITYEHNPKSLDGVGDMSQLTYLEEPNVLHNLSCRYSRKKKPDIYTNIADILIAVNPYESVPVYNKAHMQKYSTFGLGLERSPHIYRTATTAERHLRVDVKNQSILICGESGSGKTESAKYCLRFLTSQTVDRVGAPKREVSIEKQILAVNPILEAFGNAQTIMNFNSSRFAKFTKLVYRRPKDQKRNQPLPIVGSMIETYLLEKPRVTLQDKGELNFHIFYQIYQLPEKQLDRLKLAPKYKFKYLTHNYFEEEQRGAKNMQGPKACKEVRDAFDVMRISKEHQNNIFSVVAGILHLGNVKFRPTLAADEGCTLTERSLKHLEIAADLFQVPVEDLKNRLLFECKKMGTREVIRKALSAGAAQIGRDAIARGLYSNLFDWIVMMFNEELLGRNQRSTGSEDAQGEGVDNESDESEEESSDEEDDEKKADEFIGILDIFGFECFHENSFEQYCINFANERLQYFFNSAVIESEQNEYIAQGVEWKEIEIPDNEECIELLKNGLIELDSACKFGNSPSNFVENFLANRKVKNCKYVVKPKRTLGRRNGFLSSLSPIPENVSHSGSRQKRARRAKSEDLSAMLRQKQDEELISFGVQHFAGVVTYNTSSFIQKNQDKHHPDTVVLFQKSQMELLQALFPPIDESKSRRSFKSVGSTFKTQMDGLIEALGSTEAHFVRCINPNNQKRKRTFDKVYVGKQLRSGGVIDALKVIKLGYPTRIPYVDLYRMYGKPLAQSVPWIARFSQKDFCEAILIAFDLEPEYYQLGVSKVFFRPAKASVMNKLVETNGILPPERIEKLKKWRRRKIIRRVKGAVIAFVIFSKELQSMRAWKNWVNLLNPYIGIVKTGYKYLKRARVRIRKRKFLECSLILQSRARTLLAQKEVEKIRSDKEREIKLEMKRLARIKKKEEERIRKLQELRRMEEQRKQKRALEKRKLEEKMLKEKLRREEEERQRIEEIERKLEEKRLEEQRRREEEERQRAEERRKLEEKRLEEQRRLEEKRLEEQRRREEQERQRIVELERKFEEKRLEEQRRREEEERQMAEELRKLEEKRLEEQQRLEEKRLEEQRGREEQERQRIVELERKFEEKRLEEQRRHEEQERQRAAELERIELERTKQMEAERKRLEELAERERIESQKREEALRAAESATLKAEQERIISTKASELEIKTLRDSIEKLLQENEKLSEELGDSQLRIQETEATLRHVQETNDAESKKQREEERLRNEEMIKKVEEQLKKQTEGTKDTKDIQESVTHALAEYKGDEQERIGELKSFIADQMGQLSSALEKERDERHLEAKSSHAKTKYFESLEDLVSDLKQEDQLRRANAFDQFEEMKAFMTWSKDANTLMATEFSGELTRIKEYLDLINSQDMPLLENISGEGSSVHGINFRLEQLNEKLERIDEHKAGSLTKDPGYRTSPSPKPVNSYFPVINNKLDKILQTGEYVLEQIGLDVDEAMDSGHHSHSKRHKGTVCKMELEQDWESIDDFEKFRRTFTADLIKALDLTEHRIKFLGVAAGSTIAYFEIRNAKPPNENGGDSDDMGTKSTDDIIQDLGIQVFTDNSPLRRGKTTSSVRGFDYGVKLPPSGDLIYRPKRRKRRASSDSFSMPRETCEVCHIM